MGTAEAIKALHERCAVYTSAPTASKLLDLIGWTADADLTSSVLLEPCVGEGAILIEGVSRLLASFQTFGKPLCAKRLAPRIKGFEIHHTAAAVARRNVRNLLREAGLDSKPARYLADAWVRKSDFLLEIPRRATHVAANPPYVRWSKLPAPLGKRYREALRPETTRGDIAVAFLDRMLEWAKATGSISALVSDRWMFAQYGADFLADCQAKGWSLEVVDRRPCNPFVKRVGAYSAIVRFSPARSLIVSRPKSQREAAQDLHRELVGLHGTLAEAGCPVRVGPALGCGNTFLLSDAEATKIERELLWPYVGRRELEGERARLSKSLVVAPYDSLGRLINLEDYPEFAAWARLHEDKLRSRSQVRAGGRWWRTIDAIGPQWRQGPKLLLPELCRQPIVYADYSGGLPAHSLYAIWPGEWPLDVLQRVLNAGLLQLTAKAESPNLAHGWFRFYKRFLMRTPLPKWNSLIRVDQEALKASEQNGFAEAFERLFRFPAGKLPL